MRQTALIIIMQWTLQTICNGQDSTFIPTDSEPFYFPVKILRDSASHGNKDFVNTWYSRHLFAMKEPVIYLDKTQNEIYRFTWLRTFNNPISIRIEKEGEKCFLFWKLCNGAGGYEPGTLTVNKQKTIDIATWYKFKKMLDKILFWEIASKDPDLGGFDGAQWILEGKTPKQYHVTERWSPNHKSDYYKCCDFLISLTDIEIKGNSKY